MVSTLCVSGSAVVITVRFGPNSPFTAHHVQSICDNFEIPHLSVGWGAGRGAGYSLSLAPSPQQLGRGQ